MCLGQGTALVQGSDLPTGVRDAFRGPLLPLPAPRRWMGCSVAQK